MEIYNTLIIKSESKETLKKIHTLFVTKIINKDYTKLFEEDPILTSALTAGQQTKVKEGKFDAEKHLDCGAMFDDESGYDNTFDENLGKDTSGKKELLTVTIAFDSKRIIDKLVKLISKAYKVVIYQEWENLIGKEAGFQHFINGRKDWPYHYGTKISIRIDKYGSNHDDREKVALEYLMDEYDITNDPEQFQDAYEGECNEHITKENLSKLDDSLESGDWEWLEKIVFAD